MGKYIQTFYLFEPSSVRDAPCIAYGVRTQKWQRKHSHRDHYYYVLFTAIFVLSYCLKRITPVMMMMMMMVPRRLRMCPATIWRGTNGNDRVCIYVLKQTTTTTANNSNNNKSSRYIRRTSFYLSTVERWLCALRTTTSKACAYNTYHHKS